MNKTIQGIKQGNTINFSIGGKLYKKVCDTAEQANDFFKVILNAKVDPSDKNIIEIHSFLNEKFRTAFIAGLETDLNSGEIYLEGFNTPVPDTLIEVIKEYHENDFPLDAIVNFWKLLMLNPDKRVRVSLFNFITKHDFVLTDKGYMVVYKSVYYADDEKKNLSETAKYEEFISNKYLHVKKEWKCSPNKYVVYKDSEGKYEITKHDTASKWDEDDKNVEILGKLGDLYSAIVLSENKKDDEGVVYTDMHTRKMSIQLGKPVMMERHSCDSDPARDCSYGLHVGATSYVENFAGSNGVILACLVNPANVVAVPNYDHSKMRVTEYFPFANATYVDGKIDIIEQKYFEEDYCTYEVEELERLVAKVKADELPISTAKGAEEESRPMSELMKIIETRLYDITTTKEQD